MAGIDSEAGAGLPVRDVMRTAVVTVVPEMTVRELAQLFVEKRISGAPVLDPRGKPIGVVSATDVMRLVACGSELRREEDRGGSAPEGADALPDRRSWERRVVDIMTPVTFTVHPSDSLLDVARFFLKGRVHRALVMEDEVLLGIVTPFDFLPFMDAPAQPSLPPLAPVA